MCHRDHFREMESAAAADHSFALLALPAVLVKKTTHPGDELTAAKAMQERRVRKKGSSDA